MPVTEDRPAPYAPPSAIIDIISRYRNRGLPFPVNADVLARAGISESLIPRTLQSLHTLDLFNDQGNPTETLEGIRLAPEPEYKKRLADWLKGTYAGIFAFVDPTKDDGVRIRDAFRGYNPVGQQDRMVALFTGLCAAAGLIPEKAASSRPASPRAPATRLRTVVPPQSAKQRGGAAASKTSGALPPAIAGLMESLPSPADGWTAVERDRFIATFKAVLDFAIPVVQRKPTTDEAA